MNSKQGQRAKVLEGCGARCWLMQEGGRVKRRSREWRGEEEERKKRGARKEEQVRERRRGEEGEREHEMGEGKEGLCG
eukprot:3665243-Rhodomonas_salina.1